jgi:putative endonuclease
MQHQVARRKRTAVLPTALKAPRWWLYVLRTAQNKLYTGITLDVRRRVEQHSCGEGAKALRGQGPLTLVYRSAIGEQGLALRAEKRLKQCSRAEKEALLARKLPRGRLLRHLGLEADAK